MRPRLSIEEAKEVGQYIKIFKENDFKLHYEVNGFITKNGAWDSFPCIRSLNDYGKNTGIPGIQEKFFEIICEQLEIGGAGGHPLDKATPY